EGFSPMVRLSQMPRLVSLMVLTALMVALGLTFYHVVAPFLLPLFLAAVLAMLCQPLYHRVTVWTRGRSRIAAGLTTALVLVIILVPLALGTTSAARQLFRVARSAANDTDWHAVAAKVRTNETVQRFVQQYNDWTGDPIQLDRLEEEVRVWMQRASEALAS